MKNLIYKITFLTIQIFLIANINLLPNVKFVKICGGMEDIFFPASQISQYDGSQDGTLICWLSASKNGCIVVQKLNTDGNPVWKANGTTVDANLGSGFSQESDYPLLFSDKDGGAIIIYRKKFYGKEEIFTQKISYSGIKSIPVCLSSVHDGYNYSPSAVETNSDEIVVTWENFSHGDFNIHAQKIDLNGNKKWYNGAEIVVCKNLFDQRKPTIAFNDNRVCIAWLDTRNSTEYVFDLYANLISGDGKKVMYGEEGKFIYGDLKRTMVAGEVDRKMTLYNHNIVNSDKGSFIIAVEKVHEGMNSQIRAFKIDNKLDNMWNVDIESGSHKTKPLIIGKKDFGAFVFWNDNRKNENEIFGLSLDRNGNCNWGYPDGAKVSCDNMKSVHNRILPSEKNQNGIYLDGNKVYLSWATGTCDLLFQSSISLTDGSYQCANTKKIQDNVSEGEFTSITSLMDNLVIVYKQSNDIYAAIKKLSDNGSNETNVDAVISNFPNPFNPSTKIAYNILAEGFVRLSIYDIAGRMIRTLVNAIQEKGYYTIEFDGSNLSSGIYFCRLETNGYVLNKKMTMLK